MSNFYKLFSIVLLFTNLYSASLKELELSIFPPYYKANMKLDVIRGDELKNYEMDISVHYDKSLISFIKPQSRLKILKNKEKYWMYFTNFKRIVASSGNSMFSNSDFAYSDITVSLSNNYVIKYEDSNSFLLKASNKKSPYHFARIFLNDKKQIAKLEFLSKDKTTIKIMEILERKNGYASKILMKKAFTNDFKSVLYINSLRKEKIKLWKLNINYLRHL